MSTAFLPSSTLFRYTLSCIIVPFLMGTMVILMALSLERLLRLIELASTEGAGIAMALSLLSYLQPHYLGLAVPAASFMAVLLAVRKLYDHSEFVVMQSSGIAPIKLLMPIGIFGVVMMIVMLILVDFAQPHARYAYRSSVEFLKSGGSAFHLKPQVFQKIGDNMTIRAERVSNNGLTLQGVFIDRRTSANTKSTTSWHADQVLITAEKAVLKNLNEDDQYGSADKEHPARFGLILTNAKIISTKDGQRPSLLTVSRYPFEIPMKSMASYSVRGENERELTLGELSRGGVRGVSLEVEGKILQVEKHARLVQAFSVPVLILLAVPLGLMGAGRTGQAIGLVLGCVVLVLYEKLLGFAEAFAISGDLSVYVGLWGSFALLCCSAILFNIFKLEILTRSQISEYLQGFKGERV